MAVIKMSVRALLVVCCAGALAAAAESPSAAQLAGVVYRECLSRWSVECVAPRALAWAAGVADADEIRITEDLSVVRTASSPPAPEPEQEPAPLAALERVERFLDSHALRVRVPPALLSPAVAPLAPRALLRDLPAELLQPLSDDRDPDEAGEARHKKHKLKLKIRKHGFIKKVLVPFLLGLKFKASVLVPLALALIALKTWKALTLGLISLVLSGAMVIFKFTKPKVVNYEVIHYPQHVDHHDHAAGWDAHAHAPYRARALQPQDLPYAAHAPADH